MTRTIKYSVDFFTSSSDRRRPGTSLGDSAAPVFQTCLKQISLQRPGYTPSTCMHTNCIDKKRVWSAKAVALFLAPEEIKLISRLKGSQCRLQPFVFVTLTAKQSKSDRNGLDCLKVTIKVNEIVL